MIQCDEDRPLQELFDLSGRVAIVTGGSRGLGRQVVSALGEFGARVTIVARKQAELDEAAESRRSRGLAIDTIAADLGASGGAEQTIEAVMARHGRIDILVNNAGTTWGAPAEDYPDEGWDKVLQLNLTGAFALCRASAKAAFLPQGHGAIVNIASVEGLSGHHPRMIGTVAYNAAKGAVVNMTRALAAEWGPRGIRVNAIAPGYFPSKMTGATLDSHRTYLIEQTPLGKLGGPHDLKGPVLLLASDAGAHLTGQIIVVDGGTSVI